jgi:tRNA G18 (ribose-2'-O)-methylase SpoU
MFICLLRYNVEMNDSSVNGVGPHPKPWPSGSHFDPELLARGDHRNVTDEYRYWSVDAIKQDIAQRSVELEVAIENVDRDFNMGTIVRTANAFAVRRVHIIGRKQWNKRGAMMTDHYLELVHHATSQDFLNDLSLRGRQLIALETGENSVPLSSTKLPAHAVLLFGSEASGISMELRNAAHQIVSIEQAGSTRSLNVGVAAAIALYVWMQQHSLLPER